METKELKITIPEGFEIDKENSSFERIVFKKKDTKPRSWEEYCDKFKGQFYYIQDNRDNIATSFVPNGLVSAYKNYVPSKELAEAFLAMMQLMSLRQDWIHKWSIESGMTDDWKPDWKNGNETKYCLIHVKNIIKICDFYIANHTLSFPTEEMAEDFMNCFKDLLEIAKLLI